MKHRASILAVLEGYERLYPDEFEVVDRIRNLVLRYPACFERTCLPGHITGSAWIVSADGTRYLLAHHRKLNRWLQLGGHADGETEPHLVAMREAREESGITDFAFVPTEGAILPLDLDVHTIPAMASMPRHEHHDLRYLLIAAEHQTPRASRESYDIRWFTRTELVETVREEGILRMLRKTEALWNGGRVRRVDK